MSDARSQAIKNLFQQAAELGPAERERFLSLHCTDDPQLRREVEELLNSDASASSRFLDAGEQPPAAAAPLPQRIAHFRIVRRIGEGGMGTVYEAQQEHPRRTVALKLIRLGLASPSLHRRFEYEVQILGQLRHPGIAQVYEAGTHDDGNGPVPYFAMEYVRGQPLTDFVQQQGFSTRQRLALMAEICDAVHHAHQKGVVHRDLKPANILVEFDGEKPQPKILDFGVARATQSDMQQVTMHTEVGQIVGTLSYMSPEQVAGRPDELDIRSDVYSLGVILYELLSGRLPYDLRGHSVPNAGNIIRDHEPSRLSSIQSAFRGDVETIVAKALEKDRNRRYQSAAELADDLRRHLRDEPIIARPASRSYQIAKFAKRNKGLVGGVSAAFLILLVAVVAVSIALVRAKNAERLAVQRLEESRRFAARATAVNDFLQEMLSSVDPAKSLGRDVTIAQALEEAGAKIDAGTLKGEPDLESALRTTIGTTYLALGKYSEAEKQLAAALEIRRKLHPVPDSDLAASLYHMGSLYNALGRHVEEEAYTRQALDMMRQVHGPQHPEVASVMQSLGGALRRQGKFGEAEKYYRDALAMRRQLLGEKHLDVAQSINSLALLMQNQNNLAEAESLFRDALTMRREILGDPHPLVADSLNNLANLLHMRAKDEEARELMLEALDMRKKLLGENHPQLAQSFNNLAWFFFDLKQLDHAEAMYKEALAIWRKTLPPNHPDTGNVLASLGLVLLASEKYADAEAVFRESLAIRDSYLAEGHWQRFSVISGIGDALRGQGKFEQAEALLLQGVEGMSKDARTPGRAMEMAKERLVKLYESWGKPDQAAPWKSEASATKAPG